MLFPLEIHRWSVENLEAAKIKTVCYLGRLKIYEKKAKRNPEGYFNLATSKQLVSTWYMVFKLLWCEVKEVTWFRISVPTLCLYWALHIWNNNVSLYGHNHAYYYLCDHIMIILRSKYLLGYNSITFTRKKYWSLKLNVLSGKNVKFLPRLLWLV